jgi:hypothetical protein
MTREQLMRMDAQIEKEMKKIELKKDKPIPEEKNYNSLDDVISILHDEEIKGRVLKIKKLKKEFTLYLNNKYSK